MKDQSILEAIETLAAAFPWDTVRLEMLRNPQGDVSFNCTLDMRPNQGASHEYCFGETPMGVVQEMISKFSDKRDPEIMRQKALRDARERVSKLEAVIIGPPPYRPGTRIAQFVDLDPAA